MAFMDKLGQVVNKVSDVASDAADYGKAKGKLVLEKGKLNDAYQAYGKFMYEVKNGTELDKEMEEALRNEIDEHIAAIEQLEKDAQTAKEELNKN